MSNTPPYETIPNELSGDYLVQRLGPYAGAMFDTNLYRLMVSMCGDKYTGGLLELRVYPNGAFALVVPTADVIDVNTMSQRQIKCSVEAVSYAANSMLFNGLCERAAFNDDDEAMTKFYDLTHGLGDALKGSMRIAGFVTTIEPHAEVDAFLGIID